MRFILLLTTCLCLSASLAAADSIDLGFNDDSFQLGYAHGLARDEYGATSVNARFLYNDEEETFLGSLGLDFTGEPGNIPGLELGVGGKIYGGNTNDNFDFLNLGVGARATYAPPRLGGLGVDGRFAYAPEIFSFLDSDRLMESEVRLTYAAVPRVKVYLGYQNVRLKPDNGSTRTIDESIRIGFIGYF